MSSSPPHAPPRRRRSKSEIHDLVRQLQQSGLSIADFACKVGVHPVTVRAWVRDVSKAETGDASATRFVSVRLRHAPQPLTLGPSAEVFSPTGWCLSFPMAIDPRQRSKLIGILRRCPTVLSKSFNTYAGVGPDPPEFLWPRFPVPYSTPCHGLRNPGPSPSRDT